MTLEEKYDDAVHNLHLYADEIDLLKADRATALTLLTEVVMNHCDIESSDYNECDRSRCFFCDQAVELGVDWDWVMRYTRDREVR